MLPFDEAAFRRECVAEAYGNPGLGVFDALLAGLKPELDDAACEAAQQLAEALGYCRLFGVELGELDGTLPPVVAVAASQGLRAEMALILEQAKERLPEPGMVVGLKMELAVDMLAMSLMDSWATIVAIQEPYGACDGEEADTMSAELDLLAESVEKFDDKIRQRMDLLANLARTHLLTNWRKQLEGEWQHMLPWWLDGTLEKACDAPSTN